MSVIALISLSSLTWGGELEEGYKIGQYVEGILVGVLTSVRQFFGPAIIFFRSFPSTSVTLPCFTISSGLIQFHYIYRNFLGTATYSVELWRRNLPQTMPTVQNVLTGRSASVSLA